MKYIKYFEEIDISGSFLSCYKALSKHNFIFLRCGF